MKVLHRYLLSERFLSMPEARLHLDKRMYAQAEVGFTKSGVSSSPAEVLKNSLRVGNLGSIGFGFRCLTPNTKASAAVNADANLACCSARIGIAGAAAGVGAAVSTFVLST